MKFLWDEQKRQENLRKHGVDFANVKDVFDAPMLTRLDARYDYGEDRWIGIGLTQGRIVVVVYTESDNGNTIRLISARKALKYERKQYEDNIMF